MSLVDKNILYYFFLNLILVSSRYSWHSSKRWGPTYGKLVFNTQKTRSTWNSGRYATLERVSNFMFLAIHMSSDLTWSPPVSGYLWTYCCTIESVDMKCIWGWYANCSILDRKAAQRISGTQLPSIESVYHKRCLVRASKIIKDATHLNHALFSLLLSRGHYRSLRSHTSRFRRSFFPETVTMLNSSSITAPILRC